MNFVLITSIGPHWIVLDQRNHSLPSFSYQTPLKTRLIGRLLLNQPLTKKSFEQIEVVTMLSANKWKFQVFNAFISVKSFILHENISECVCGSITINRLDRSQRTKKKSESILRPYWHNQIIQLVSQFLIAILIVGQIEEKFLSKSSSDWKVQRRFLFPAGC